MLFNLSDLNVVLEFDPLGDGKPVVVDPRDRDGQELAGEREAPLQGGRFTILT